MITEQEGSLLKQVGLTCVAHLFQEDDLTGALRHEDKDILDRVGPREAHLTYKCKKLRKALSEKRWPLGTSPVGGFAQCLKGQKWSRLYRKVNRKSIDQGIAGPPSFFTRRRDGIPVPTLDKFMQGYTKMESLYPHLTSSCKDTPTFLR